MKSYQLIKYGKNEKLHLQELPLPKAGPEDVLVEIYAASINPLDAKIMKGDFKPILPYKAPFTLGHDFAGIVSYVGKNVTKFKVGDEVYGRPRDFRIGTFAEFIAVHQDDIAIKPKNLNMEEAASIPLIGLTAWQALVEKGSLKSGDKVFIQAGSGGVGSFSIQLAKHLGAFVATTTSNKNLAFVKSLGADLVLDYTIEDFEKNLSGYNLVLNSLDESTLRKSLSILRPNGNAISISGPPDLEFAKDLRAGIIVNMATRLLSRNIRKLASKIGVNYSFLFMKANGSQLSKITRLIEEGVIKPVLDKVYKLDQINDAINYIETGRAKGKVVISIK